VSVLKWGLKSQQNVFRKQSSDSSSALLAKYHVAHLLAKESKPFSDGEFFLRKCWQHSARGLSGKRNFLIL